MKALPRKKAYRSFITILLMLIFFAGAAAFSNTNVRAAAAPDELAGLSLADNQWVDMTTGELKSDAVPSGSWIDEGNYDVSWYNTTDYEFEIGTAAELAGFAYILYNYEDVFYKTVRLVADIDMSAHQWVYLQFCGILDGQGHTVSGIFFTLTDENIEEYMSEIGFISFLNCGVILNVNLTNTYITYNSSDYSPSYVTAGAIAGYNYKGTIINCSARAYVESNGLVGGIVGFSKQGGDIVCLHNNYFVGSLNSVTLSNPDSSFEAYIGAIAGEVENETVYNNYAVAYSLSSGSYISEAVGNTRYNCDVSLNYCFDGEAFAADYAAEDQPGFVSDGVLLSALTNEQL